MSTSTLTPPVKPSPHTPTLLVPTAGQPVDGSAALFEWTPVSGAQTYHLQVATDAAFEDVLYTVETGPTTLMTLYELLPEDGSTFYWRVRATTHRGDQPWSEGAPFQAQTDQHVQEHESAQQSAASLHASQPDLPDGQAQDDAVIEPPFLTGETSRGVVLFYLLTLLGSFSILVLFLLYNSL